MRDLFERLKHNALYVTHDKRRRWSYRTARCHALDFVNLARRWRSIRGQRFFVAGFVGTPNGIHDAAANDSNDSEGGASLGELRCPLAVSKQASLVWMFARSVCTHGTIEPRALSSRAVKSAVLKASDWLQIDSGECHIRAETSPYVAEIRKGQHVWVELPADRMRVLAM